MVARAMVAVYLLLLAASLRGIAAFAAEEKELQESIDYSRHRSVAVSHLNGLTFEGNVLKSEWAEDWFTFFCVDWLAHCPELRRAFAVAADELHVQKNGELLLTSRVRFAEVDCATDKVLCNKQLVEEYPTVVHYHMGERRAVWTAHGGRLEKDQHKLGKWMRKQLDKPMQKHAEELTTGHIDRALVARAVAMGLACASMVVWFVGMGAELWSVQTLRALRPVGFAKKVPWTRAKTADALAADYAGGRAPMTRLEQCLPREWAKRASLEL